METCFVRLLKRDRASEEAPRALPSKQQRGLVERHRSTSGEKVRGDGGESCSSP